MNEKQKQLMVLRKQQRQRNLIPFIKDVPPCPFCGSQPKLITQMPNDYSVYKIVRCTNENCYIRPSTRLCKTAKEARDEWSKRA